MGNYTNLCIMMHTTDTVMFRSLFLIMTKFFGEKVKRRDRRKDRFGDKSIKFFPIFIWILNWSISIRSRFDDWFV